jgi:transcriptional regulator with AAA-type ATPase domain
LEDLGLEKTPEKPAVQPSANDNGFPPLPCDGIELNALEEHYIKEAFKKAGGNETKAAQLLGMSYYSFRYRRKKLKELQIERVRLFCDDRGKQ